LNKCDNPFISLRKIAQPRGTTTPDEQNVNAIPYAALQGYPETGYPRCASRALRTKWYTLDTSARSGRGPLRTFLSALFLSHVQPKAKAAAGLNGTALYACLPARIALHGVLLVLS